VNATTLLLAGAVALMVPLLFAGLGELVSELSGTINISLEGMMLAGAFTGYLAAATTGSLWAGYAGAALGGMLIAVVQGALSLVCEANQIVTGVVLNILVLGATTFGLSMALAGGLPRTVATVPVVSVPILRDVPVIGPALFEQNPMVYVALLLVPLTWFFLNRHPLGLALRAAGDRATAAEALGISVIRTRQLALMTCGALAGVGGGQLVLATLGAFAPNLTAGRGFIALAAVVFGGWRVLGTVGAVALFGLADTLQLRAQALGIEVPYQFLVMAPYAVTVVALVVLGKRARAPLDLGTAHVRF
jgi:ABC-type uncharacterized transport system permease subunit